MALIPIPVGLSFVTWTGPATPLSSAAWIGNVTAVYDVNINRLGFISYSQASAFPAFTGLAPSTAGAVPRVYLFNTATAFSLTDTLVGVVVGTSSVQLSAPVSPQATVGSGTSLSLTASSVSFASGYKLYRSDSAGGTYVLLGTAVLATPSYADTGLTLNVTYYYKWQAVGNGGTYLDSALGLTFTGTPTAAPVISSFSPTTGAAGTTIVITGLRFSGATLVAVNNATVASYTVNTDTQITAITSSSQVTGSVQVTTPNGSAVSSANFVVPLLVGNTANAPAFASITVEATSTRRIIATFNKPLDPAFVPVAKDFVISDTHRVIGQLAAGVSGTTYDIPVSGYDAPTATGLAVVSGTSTTFFNKEGRGRIWQSGTVRKLRFYCPAFVAGAKVSFLVGQTGTNTQAIDISGLLTYNGTIQTITLVAPVPVNADDIIGLGVVGDTASLGFVAVASNAGAGGSVYGPSVAGASAAFSGYVPIVCYAGTGPLFSVMGDSQLAGYPQNQPYCMPGYARSDSMANFVGGALGVGFQDMSWSGQTTPQMLARFDQDIVVKRPRYCVIGGGYNNSGDPSGVISDITAMGNKCVAAGIVPIFVGSLPARNAATEDQSLANLLKQINDGVKAYASSINAKFLSFADLLGVRSTVGVWYTYKDSYYIDGIHPNIAGYNAEGAMLNDYLLSITPVTLIGTRLELQVNRAFVKSDQPNLTLAFTGTTTDIHSTDGGTLHTFTPQPLVLNLPNEPEILNFLVKSNNQSMADKALAPGVAGYLAYESARDSGTSIGLDEDITLMTTFQGNTNAYAQAGIFFGGGQPYWASRLQGFNLLGATQPYYRLDRNAAGLVRLLSSTDNAAFTATGYQVQLDPTKTLYICAKGPIPTLMRALNVTMY